MADHSKIEWTEATWNPIAGCSLVSPGCTHCYAMRDAHRLAGNPNPRIAAKYAGTTKIVARGGEAKGRVGKKLNTPVWTGRVNLADDQVLTQPLRWTKPRRIFVNSMSDLFHPDVPDAWIDRIFAVMALEPQHTFQVLTKRAERMREYLIDANRAATVFATAERHHGRQWHDADAAAAKPENWPLKNVWLGISAEDQTRADERIPALLDTPAAIRWVSAEPLLGRINFNSTLGGTLWIGGQRGCAGDPRRSGAMHHGIGTPDCPRHLHHHHDERCRPGLDWIVAGGESGRGARPMHPDWVRAIRDQCARAGVPFLFKQWGSWEVAIDRERDDPDWRAAYSREFRDEGKTRWLNLAGGCGFHGERFHVIRHVGKKRAGRLLDGVTHDGYPARAA